MYMAQPFLHQLAALATQVGNLPVEYFTFGKQADQTRLKSGWPVGRQIH